MSTQSKLIATVSVTLMAAAAIVGVARPIAAGVGPYLSTGFEVPSRLSQGVLREAQRHPVVDIQSEVYWDHKGRMVVEEYVEYANGTSEARMTLIPAEFFPMAPPIHPFIPVVPPCYNEAVTASLAANWTTGEVNATGTVRCAQTGALIPCAKVTSEFDSHKRDNLTGLWLQLWAPAVRTIGPVSCNMKVYPYASGSTGGAPGVYKFDWSCWSDETHWSLSVQGQSPPA